MSQERIPKTDDAFNKFVAMGWDFEDDFYQLPRSAELKEIPWSGDYWASSNFEIAKRWNRSSGQAMMPSESQIRDMSPKELSQLSPAEKYDIARGRFDYPIVAAILRKLEHAGGVNSIPDWEGLCHGWANAALNFRQPKATLFTGSSGIELPFAASDVKALLSWFQGAWQAPEKAAFTQSIGKTCPFSRTHPSFDHFLDCIDVNPAVFHAVLANRIGLRGQGFVIDAVPDLEVWNHPVFAYLSTIDAIGGPSAVSHPEAVKVLRLTTRISYGAEVKPHWSSLSEHRMVHDDYVYELDLNAAGRMVDGRWISFKRPDTIWFYPEFAFAGDAQQLGDLYRQSISEIREIENPALDR